MGPSHKTSNKTPKGSKPPGSSRSQTPKSARSSDWSSKTQSSTISSSSLYGTSHASIHDTASHFSPTQSTSSSRGHLPTADHHTVLTQASSISSDYHPYQAFHGHNYLNNSPLYAAGQHLCTNPRCHDADCYTHAHASTLQEYHLLGVGTHFGSATQETECDDSLRIGEDEDQLDGKLAGREGRKRR